MGKKWRLIVYSMIVDTLISLMIFVDLIYIRYFSTPPSFAAMPLLCSSSPSGTAVGALINWEDWFVFADIVMMPFIMSGFANIKAAYSYRISANSFGIVFLLCLMMFSIMPIKCLVRNEPWFYSGIPMRRFWLVTPPVYHAADLLETITARTTSLVITDNERDKIQDWFEKEERIRSTNSAGNGYHGIAKGKNLIVLQVESLENCLIGKEVNGKQITPFLNQLARDEVYFARFYSQVLGGHSSDAGFIVNTSLYPISKGSVNISYPLNTYNAFPLQLKKLGYTTIAFHGNGKGFWNRYQVYPRLGIDSFVAKGEMHKNDIVGLGISDDSLFTQGIDVIKNIKQPFYAFFVTLTSHFPYNDLPKDKELGIEKVIRSDKIFTEYLYAINYTDKAIGHFFKKLKEEGLADNTVVVIYGDHGAIPEKYRNEFCNKYYIDNVPLIITGLGKGNKVMKNIGGLVDIYPTLANIMGINVADYGNTVMGKDLFSDRRSFAVIPKTRSLFVDAGKCDDDCAKHEIKALEMADIIIRGNYFGRDNDHNKNEGVKYADRH
jgi:phosphoglycerol transferase MdoB-like AlkP superfamily enzyme